MRQEAWFAKVSCRHVCVAPYAAACVWHRTWVTVVLCAIVLWLRSCVTAAAGARGHVSLLNIITELKKTCNHPFLFESADEYRWDHSAVIYS